MKIYCAPAGSVIDGEGSDLKSPRLFFQEDGRSNVGVDTQGEYVFIKNKDALKASPELNFSQKSDLGTQVEQKLKALDIEEAIVAHKVDVPDVHVTYVFGREDINSPDDVFAFTSVNFELNQINAVVSEHNRAVEPANKPGPTSDNEAAYAASNKVTPGR